MGRRVDGDVYTVDRNTLDAQDLGDAVAASCRCAGDWGGHRLPSCVVATPNAMSRTAKPIRATARRNIPASSSSGTCSAVAASSAAI